MSYPPIEHHGVIGDLHTVALVGAGRHDRLALPPAFRLAQHLRLDPRRHTRRLLPDHRHLRRAPPPPDVPARLERPGDPVPHARRRRGGRGLHAHPSARRGPRGTEDHQIVRIVRGDPRRAPVPPGLRSGLRLRRGCAGSPSRPGPGAASSPGAVCVDLATPLALTLGEHSRVRGVRPARRRRDPGRAGPVRPRPLPRWTAWPSAATGIFAGRCAYWQDWISRSHYQGRWREMVKRSCLALKLMTLRPDGRHRRGAHDEPARTDRRPAQLGLPLHLGAGRGLHGLRLPARRASRTRPRTSCEFLERRFRELGRRREPAGALRRGRAHGAPRDDPRPSRGLRGSRPVRAGNDAARQFQLDIVGRPDGRGLPVQQVLRARSRTSSG